MLTAMSLQVPCVQDAPSSGDGEPGHTSARYIAQPCQLLLTHSVRSLSPDVTEI